MSCRINVYKLSVKLQSKQTLNITNQNDELMDKKLYKKTEKRIVLSI